MRFFAVLSAALVLSACNSVKNEKLPPSMDDPATVEIAKKLDDEDRKTLTSYLMRREMAKAFGGRSLNDNVATVGEALEAQKKWAADLSESQQKAEQLKMEVEQKRKAVAQQIQKAVTVAFIDAEYMPSSFESGRYQDYEKLTMAVENHGPKAIKALKGKAVFIDTFGDVFVSLPMQFEETIQSGDKKVIELGKELNKFMDDDKKLMSLDSKKKFRFEPEQIVFADDSTVKAPELIE